MVGSVHWEALEVPEVMHRVRLSMLEGMEGEQEAVEVDGWRRWKGNGKVWRYAAGVRTVEV